MFKYNDGNGAVLCDVCRKVIKEGVTEDGAWFHICEDCTKVPAIIDNFDAIGDLLTFDDESTFYWVQIIKRRKDNPGMHGDYQCFKEYCLYSYQDLLRHKEEMIKISKTHNARVVLWINRRDIKELAIPIAQLTLEYIQSKQFKALPRVFEHTCGKHHKKGITTTYIVDVDSKDPEYLNKVASLVYKCSPENFEFYGLLPTIHGYHILCSGFNLDLFAQLCVIEEIERPDIHKDNPTVLYFCPQ